MFYKYLLLLAFCAICHQTEAQENNQHEQIESVIKQLFNGMRSGDSMMVKDLFTPEATLSSISTNKQNEVVKRTNLAKGFVTAIGQPHDEIWDEQIWSYDIKIDGPMAQAWTEYTFYRGNSLSHCGVNVFEMIYLKEGWKISGITDTRRKTMCKTKAEAEVNLLMNDWHKSAATADEDIFFGSMTENAIYIGTDASERWSRDEMQLWSKKNFDQDSAWSFTTISRNVEFDASENIAWFDELLDTWMGTCRGSGVVIKTPDGWKIQHYHLSIAVPNDQINSYLELIGKSRSK